MKPIRDGALNFDKLCELLQGPQSTETHVRPYYAGYCGDTEAMREDWAIWGECILAWLNDQKRLNDAGDLESFGIMIDEPLWSRGFGGRPCWAERHFGVSTQ